MTMSSKQLDTVLLEAEIYNLLEDFNGVEKRIKERVPAELLFTADGSLNLTLRWGIIIQHLRLIRATLRGFLE